MCGVRLASARGVLTGTLIDSGVEFERARTPSSVGGMDDEALADALRLVVDHPCG